MKTLSGWPSIDAAELCTSSTGAPSATKCSTARPTWRHTNAGINRETKWRRKLRRRKMKPSSSLKTRRRLKMHQSRRSSRVISVGGFSDGIELKFIPKNIFYLKNYSAASLILKSTSCHTKSHLPILWCTRPVLKKSTKSSRLCNKTFISGSSISKESDGGFSHFQNFTSSRGQLSSTFVIRATGEVQCYQEKWSDFNSKKWKFKFCPCWFHLALTWHSCVLRQPHVLVSLLALQSARDFLVLQVCPECLQLFPKCLQPIFPRFP